MNRAATVPRARCCRRESGRAPTRTDRAAAARAVRADPPPWLSLTNVGYMPEKPVCEVNRIDVAVPNEENLPVIGGELGIALGINSLSEPLCRSRREVVDVEVAVELDHGVATVVRALARSEPWSRRVDLLDGNPLRLNARDGANTELLRRLTPVGAWLEPREVDPLAVRAPVDVAGLSAVELRATHDVLYREVECGRLLRRQGARDGEEQ